MIAAVAPVVYHLGHLCINAGGVHTCATPHQIFDTMLGGLLSAALLLGKVSGVLLACEGAMHRIRKVLDNHPLHRIHFWHVYHRHSAPNVAACEDGQCKVVELQ